MPEEKIIQIGLVDDHTLFRKGLVNLIEMVGSNYRVQFEADNGIDMQKKLNKNNLPDIILMDVNMPGMDGYASVEWLKKYYPKIKILVVSMIQKEESIVHMLKLGVKGYLSKDVEPKDLGEAIEAVINKGFYYTDFVTGKLVHSIRAGGVNEEDKNSVWQTLTAKERDFLSYCCSDLTYHEIANKMTLSHRTIEGYRGTLCDKLQVKNRIGLAVYAIKNGLVEL